MALHGYSSLYKRNKLQALCFGQTPITLPNPYYFGLHFATRLAGPAAPTDTTISVNHTMAVGSNLIIAPQYSGSADLHSEQRIVQSVSGVGPYTITVDSALGFAHLTNVYVAFDPGIDGAEAIEHSGDSYARVSLDNTTGNFPAPSSGQTNSGAQLTWSTPVALWGLATHVLGYDDLTTGNLWDAFVLNSFLILDTTIPTPRIVTGNLIAQTELPL